MFQQKEQAQSGELTVEGAPRGHKAVRSQTSASWAPEPQSFPVSYCRFRRRVGQSACLRVDLLQQGGRTGVSGQRASLLLVERRSLPARGPSTSRAPLLSVQRLTHLQLRPQGPQEPVALQEQLLPQRRLLLQPGKAPPARGGEASLRRGAGSPAVTRGAWPRLLACWGASRGPLRAQPLTSEILGRPHRHPKRDMLRMPNSGI